MMTTLAGRARAMTEDDLLQAVLDLCRLYHLRTLHIRPARTDRGWRTPVAGDGAGYPDLTIVGTRVLFRELKADRGRIGPDQTAWITALREADQDAAVWRPGQWLDGTIRAELEAIRW